MSDTQLIAGASNGESVRLATVPIGHYLAKVRDDAGLSQAQLAQKVTFSSATLSRIESGEKAANGEELSSILEAIGTDQAQKLCEYLKEDWDELPRPAFGHPDQSILWQANLALRKLKTLKEDGDLKAVFLRQVDLYETELKRLAGFLLSREHSIAFIGSIGVGKSTGICKLTGLLKPNEDKLDRQIVLETGAGGITLCEVHIIQGPRYGLRIVPRSDDSIRQDVEDLCKYLLASTTQAEAGQPPTDNEEGDTLGISKEVVRAIRNMAGIAEKRVEENGRRVRIDPAKKLALKYGNTNELCIHILTEMNLLRRNRRDEWYPENDPRSPAEWLQDLFLRINNGRHPEFTLPKKIEIIIPDSVFANPDLTIRIIDTKGIDQTAERLDLECHFDDPRTLVVLCSRFNDAPEVALQNLLRRAKEAGARDISGKTVLLILPRPDEAMAVKYDDGGRVTDDQEGYDLKADQIRLRLNQQGLADVSIQFYNSRGEEPDGARQSLLKIIVFHRQNYAGQIIRLSETVDRLEENRENEETRLVFEHAMGHLRTWIQSNQALEIAEGGVHKSLVAAINGTRYASTIRAAVVRTGDWYNLDYYHHLSYGVRTLATRHIGLRINTLKVIVANLIENPEMEAAKGFLQSLDTRVDAAVDDTYIRLQVAGREAFKQTLAKDGDFWEKCEARWGQGPGYRSAIRDMTDEEFTEDILTDVQSVIVRMVEEEWAAIISLMANLLRESSVPEQCIA